jgi:hypothetical protein
MHPDVVVSIDKEVHFFDARYELGLQWYRSQFPNAAEARAVGEATPNYMFSPVALDRIRSTLPDVKLILLLRNPIDRAYSHYWHDRSRGKIDREFEEIVTRELAGEDIGPAAYIARGRYDEQVGGILSRFGRESLFVETFENMAAKPDTVYAAVCRFIGVDDSFRPPNLGHPANAFVEFRSLALRSWAQRLPKRAESLIGRVNQRKSARYPEMDADVRARLRTVYADMGGDLSRLLGWDPPTWT